jgi:hypothetical protein
MRRFKQTFEQLLGTTCSLSFPLKLTNFSNQLHDNIISIHDPTQFKSKIIIENFAVQFILSGKDGTKEDIKHYDDNFVF